jgi:hypothetical protein
MIASNEDRRMWEEHLALAEAHIAQGEQTVARQRRIVEDLERDGHDARTARELLIQFEEVLRTHLADRDRLRHELGLAGGGPSRA